MIQVFWNVDEPAKKVLYNVFLVLQEFALAFATSLAFEMDPSSQIYEQDRMRLHLANCFKINNASSPSFLAIKIDFSFGS